jgi:HEAT repeat protein
LIDDQLDAIGKVFAELERHGRAHEYGDAETYDAASYLSKVQRLTEELLRGVKSEREQGDLVDAVSKCLEVWPGSGCREWAADLYSKLGTRRALEPLLKLVQQRGRARVHAAAALAQILQPAEFQGLSREERAAVVWGLVAAFDPVAFAAPEIKATTRRSLVLFGAAGPEQLVQLVPELVGAHPNMLTGFERVLIDMGLSAASGLAGLLKHEDHRVRASALRSLGKILADASVLVGHASGVDRLEQAAALADIAEKCVNRLREIAENKRSTASALAAELLNDLRTSVG